MWVPLLKNMLVPQPDLMMMMMMMMNICDSEFER